MIRFGLEMFLNGHDKLKTDVSVHSGTLIWYLHEVMQAFDK